MALIRPRLHDYYGIPVVQAQCDYAIPFLNEDIPLHLDPFLLWRSSSLQDNSLHTAIVNSFNHLGHLFLKGGEKEAIKTLVSLSECDEVGFGDSKKRKGHRIGEELANQVLDLFRKIPQINKAGFVHFEEVQFFIDNFSKDRVSDIACNLLKSFLIDYTIQECEKEKIPRTKKEIEVYDYKSNLLKSEKIDLPCNPENSEPIIFVPKRWLRYIPWINYDDYFENYYLKEAEVKKLEKERIAVLTYNRNNYDLVEKYRKYKELQKDNCKNDPLFSQLPVMSVERKWKTIEKIKPGLKDGAYKEFEDNVCQVMANVLYPRLDFADTQSRTIDGTLIRDLIFYNNKSTDFLIDLFEKYQCRQIVMELKNVLNVDTEHVNQLNRYLKEEFGSFGIVITRNPPSKPVMKNTIDLWSSQRKCIIFLIDEDIKMMCDLFKSKQREPLDVVKKKYVEFTRQCPS